VSKQVKTWLREYNQTVLQEVRTGKRGVRIIPCWLPTKSPWLNRIEPKWVHGKRAVVEPARLLTAQEVKQRVCDYFGCEVVVPLTRARFLEPALGNDIIGLAITEADNSIYIIYQAQYGERLTFVRPLASWLETVEW
jgi:hypothetical protein